MIFARLSMLLKFHNKPTKKKKHQQKVKTSKIIEQKVNASPHEVTTNNSGLRNSSNGAFFLQFDVTKVSVYANNKKKTYSKQKQVHSFNKKLTALFMRLQ